MRSRWLNIGQVLFFACSWTETDSRSINWTKKERGRYQAIFTGQTWSIKDLLWLSEKFFLRVVPSGQDSSILPARVPNLSAAFDSSCPLMEVKIRYIRGNSIGYKDCAFESPHVGTVLRMTITSLQIVSSFKNFLLPLMFGLIGFDRGKTRKNK